MANTGDFRVNLKKILSLAYAASTIEVPANEDRPKHRTHTFHSLIISREVLILTLSIFNALNVCISWYSLCPRECTEKYFPRECISRTLPRENIGDTLHSVHTCVSNELKQFTAQFGTLYKIGHKIKLTILSRISKLFKYFVKHFRKLDGNLNFSFCSAEAEKPGWRVGIANRKVFARAESFCMIL